MVSPRLRFSRQLAGILGFVFAGMLLMGAECPPPDANMNMNGNENTNSNENSNDNLDDGVDTSGIPDENVIGLPSALLIGAEVPGGKFFVFGDPKHLSENSVPDYTTDLETNFQGGMTLNKAGSLIATGNSVAIFDSMESIESGTFDRQVFNNDLDSIIAMAMDIEHDRIYLGNSGIHGYTIQMLENTTDSNFTGQVPATHRIGSDSFNTRGIDSMAIGPDDRLYVVTRNVGDAEAQLLVFKDASTINQDDAVPEHVVEFPEYQGDSSERIFNPVVDEHDNLIMLAVRTVDGSTDFGIVTIPGASGLDGVVTGTKFVKPPAPGPLVLSVIDGAAYTATFGHVSIFKNIVGREGEIEPDLTLTVNGLNQPAGFVVFE